MNTLISQLSHSFLLFLSPLLEECSRPRGQGGVSHLFCRLRSPIRFTPCPPQSTLAPIVVSNSSVNSRHQKSLGKTISRFPFSFVREIPCPLACIPDCEQSEAPHTIPRAWCVDRVQNGPREGHGAGRVFRAGLAVIMVGKGLAHSTLHPQAGFAVHHSDYILLRCLAGLVS